MSGFWRGAARGVGLVAAVALCGALPGEMRGCDTDLSDEVDHVQYCRDRCEVLCERVVTCGLYVSTDEPEDGGTIEDLCRAECEEEYSCRNPFICANEDRYLSEREVSTCLEEWGALGCSVFERAEGCGSAFEICPRPEACTAEVLCDPPEWE